MIRRPPRSPLFPSTPLFRSIRPNCPACRSGEKHPSHVLYCRQQGRRFSLYVPEELVPQVQRWLDNGRSEEHTSELQSQSNLVCRLLLEKKKGHDCGNRTLLN